MITIYFSGTGNSKYIAEGFSKRMGAACHSIEEESKINFPALIAEHDTICFCYPIHSSMPSSNMKYFVLKYQDNFRGKKIITFCTQMKFSGDGGKAITRFLKDVDVIYSRQIDMPINLSNIPFIRNRIYGSKHQVKVINRLLDKITNEVKSGKKVLQGWSKYAEWLGSLQNRHADKFENAVKSTFRADEKCISCGICVRECPTKNLYLEENSVKHRNNCVACYRCVNHCPVQAAQALIKRSPRRQYLGFSRE